MGTGARSSLGVCGASNETGPVECGPSPAHGKASIDGVSGVTTGVCLIRAPQTAAGHRMPERPLTHLLRRGPSPAWPESHRPEGTKPSAPVTALYKGSAQDASSIDWHIQGYSHAASVHKEKLLGHGSLLVRQDGSAWEDAGQLAGLGPAAGFPSAFDLCS